MPNGDKTAATEAVAQLLSDPGLRRIKGGEARAAAEDANRIDPRPTWEAIFRAQESGAPVSAPRDYDPDTLKILLDTVAEHSEMGNAVRKKRVNALYGLKKTVDSLTESVDGLTKTVKNLEFLNSEITREYLAARKEADDAAEKARILTAKLRKANRRGNK